MRLRTWGYLWHEALRGIWQNRLLGLASLSTVTACLTALAGVVLVAVNLQHMATFVESQVELVAYLRPDFNRVWTDLLLEKVRALPGVADARFVTKEEALERLRRQFGEQAHLLEGLDEPGANPLRDSVEIALTSPEAAEGVALGLRGIESVEDVSYRQDVVDRLVALTRLLRLLGLALVGLLAAATVFVISNTIRLTVFARRREIAIMKLVGATDAFIRWPFVLEGVILGLAGALVASGLAAAGYGYVVRLLSAALPFLPVLGPDPLLWNLAKLLLGVGACIGAVGSALSLRRFLPV